MLEEVNLTPEEKQQLVARIDNLHKPPSKIMPMFLMAITPLPSAVSLGMNGVPVLNQGSQNTCAIFAATAALEALYGHGDYISQVCYLQLTRSSDNRGSYGAWVGDDEERVINTIKKMGVISKEYEHQHGCGGLYSYPAHLPYYLSSYGDPITAEDYLQHSEKIFTNV